MSTEESGRLAENIVHFARLLRGAGLPVGPGHALDAVRAVEVAGVASREDFRATLHAVFVSRHEQTILFDQAFALFWKKRGFIEKLIAMMSPLAAPQEQSKPKPGATRLAEALAGNRPKREAEPEIERDARLTMSASEVLQRKDFAQMTTDEIAQAKRTIAKLRLPEDWVMTRRWRHDPRGSRLDPRQTLRKAMSRGGDILSLERRERVLRHPPVVALCDISGSMSDYTRIFLHFLHRLTEERRRVETFLFGTRLTNVTRSLRSRDIDVALAGVSDAAPDWSGGTRIGASLHAFNRTWSRRVLGQGAIVLLFTDGLERDGVADLAFEMERLHKSCRRLIWLNPLLRYDRFEPRAAGIRAMLPHVDEFRPVHHLASLDDLAKALSAPAMRADFDPRVWAKRAI
ncbi:MAG: hypothetical protein JWO64_1444 [Hyphomicrobiales bacterium]|nr:hypothetical protein [Hyphomicrobiales bacterium]